MSKINNLKTTYKSLSIISVFILGLIFSLPQNAFAAYRFTGGGGGYSYEDDGQHGTSFGGGYNVENTGNLTPIIYSISPNTVTSGSGSKTININGENFVPNSVAKLGSLERPTSYVNSNHLLMQLSTNDINGSGEYLITVHNPGGGDSNVEIFTINKSNRGGGTNSTGTVSGATTDGATNNLGANAISSGIRLSGFMIWLIIAILILIVVMLWRKIFGEKERNKPLKHA